MGSCHDLRLAQSTALLADDRFVVGFSRAPGKPKYHAVSERIVNTPFVCGGRRVFDSVCRSRGSWAEDRSGVVDVLDPSAVLCRTCRAMLTGVGPRRLEHLHVRVGSAVRWNESVPA